MLGGVGFVLIGRQLWIVLAGCQLWIVLVGRQLWMLERYSRLAHHWSSEVPLTESLLLPAP